MTVDAGALRIVHFASLARSGETMLLRALDAHPQVHVVHDLRAINTDDEQRLYRLLRVWPLPTLPRAALDAQIAPGHVATERRVLLLKQGVFAPRHRAPGFGLIRNPYAVFCSLWSYDARLAGQVPTPALNLHHWLERRLPRLLVWADASLPALLPALRRESDPVRQFLLYWRARTEQILARHETVVAYEDFVRDPARALRAICAGSGLTFDPAMLDAHRRWPAGARGHGGIHLDAPIRPVSAWTPDPLVPIEPFARAVDTGPVPAWCGLYARAGAPALPLAA